MCMLNVQKLLAGVVLWSVFPVMKDVVYVSFGTNLAVLVAVSSILPECFVLASFWFKTLVSLIDHSPEKLL